MQKKLYLQAIIFLLGLLVNQAYAGDTYQKAKVLFEQKKYSKALEKLNSGKLDRGDDLENQFLKGLVLIKLERLAEASEIFEELAVNFPRNPEIHNNLAVIYTLTKNPEKAEESLKNALNTNASYKTAYENLSKLYAQMASEAYKKAIQNNLSSETNEVQLSLLVNISQDKLSDKKTNKPNTENKKLEGIKKTEIIRKKEIKETEKTLTETVQNWASAWENKNVEKYLSYYATSFKPSKKSWEKWASGRRSRIINPKNISVKISSIKILSKSEVRAVVSFKQDYQSNFIKSKGTKTLVMIKYNDRWLIQKELFSKTP